MFKILDCTLRDGGYYNHWDFSPAVVQAYIQAMVAAKIDYVELGLRNFAQPGFRGAFAYTSEDFLNRLELPEGPTYGVMVDAKTILSSPLSVEDAIDSLFVNSSKSKIGLVRVAAHFHEVEHSGAIIEALKEKGYMVGYNLMQAGGKSSELIAKMANIAQTWHGLDVLYFADSLGNMDGDEVKRIVAALREHWHGELGIHTHNNMAKALDNCLTARSVGVKWLDSTITGMGRGAGNAQTENLLAVVSQENDKYSATPVYELAIRYFEGMQKKCGWGSNLLYFLGAQHNLHPTYIQNLLADSHFGTDEVIGAIDYLSQQDNKSSYSGDVYRAALSFSGENKQLSGSTDLCALALQQEVLIIANGPGLHQYLADVIAYIEKKKPIVIAINVIAELGDYVNYYCLSHNNKFLSESESYNTLIKPVILPKHRFSQVELALFSEECQLIDYGLEVRTGQFTASDKSCVVPFDITVAYAFSVAEIMKANNVTLVGFNGYESHDTRQLEMLETINLMHNFKITDDLVALTPTTYPLTQGSIYAPV
ncbi:aldolase catalytic domain-containing protein [Colwellia sp. KU-HH00111]|uniref:aldolase catalytic domain-containing protein n=1 Tax=Colwellia sp. KU-HH00111 TaxID=3127652 RepID=UPI003107C21E